MTLQTRSITRRAGLIAAATLALAPALTFAQAWPAKPVKITVAYPAGGVSDNVARLLADRLAPALGQSVLVDN